MPISQLLHACMEKFFGPACVGEPPIVRTVLLAEPPNGETPDGQELLVDPCTEALVAVCNVDHQLCLGKQFTASYSTPAGAPVAVLSFLLTPSEEFVPHLEFRIAVGADAHWQLFRNPDASGGTPIITTNKNETSTEVPTLAITHTPTINDNGAPMTGEIFIPGGSAGAISQGSVMPQSRWILSPERAYLLLVTERSPQNDHKGVIFEWFERPAGEEPII